MNRNNVSNLVKIIVSLRSLIAIFLYIALWSGLYIPLT